MTNFGMDQSYWEDSQEYASCDVVGTSNYFPLGHFHNWVIFCTFVGILGTFGAFWGTIVTL